MRTRSGVRLAHETIGTAAEARIEDPVNEFIKIIVLPNVRPRFTAHLPADGIRLLFTRSVPRQAASAVNARTKMHAFRALLKDHKKLTELAARYTGDMINRRYCLGRMVTE